MQEQLRPSVCGTNYIRSRTMLVSLSLLLIIATVGQGQDSKPDATFSKAEKSNVSDKIAGDDAKTSAEALRSKEKKHRYPHKKYNNVVYSRGEDYRLLCDIYKPEGQGPFPAVIAIHGGAWRHGSKFQMMRHAWKLVASGYVVVAINYRLSPEHKFPAQVHDCKQAVRWVRFKAKKLNVDPEQIAVFGYSAGGHLGAMLGTTDTRDGLEGEVDGEFKDYSSRVQCVVIGGAPCEFDWIKSDSLLGWLGESPQDAPELYRQAAPLTYVTKDDPPFIIFHGNKDIVVPPASSKKLHDRLQQIGIECRYQVVNGKGHFATFSDTTWLDDAIAFMDEKLGRVHHQPPAKSSDP